MTRNPLVQIYDNVLSDPAAYRKFALSQSFNEDNRFYKGFRSAAAHPLEHFHAFFEEKLQIRIPEWGKHLANGMFHVTWSGMERVIHSDTQHFAAALYLTPDAPLMAGTQFWQSKATKLFRSPSPNDPRADSLMKQTYQDKLLDVTAWEKADYAANVFNRMAVWDARLLHSAAEHFGHDMETGRLVQLFFFDAAEPHA